MQYALLAKVGDTSNMIRGSRHFGSQGVGMMGDELKSINIT